MAESQPTEAAKPEQSVPKAAETIKNLQAKLGAKQAEIDGKVQGFGARVRKLLRFEKPSAPEKHNIVLEPPYIVGDEIDAFPGTFARIGFEFAEKQLATIRAGFKAIFDPPVSPINTVKHPLKYMANYGRLITAPMAMFANMFNAIPRSIDDIYSRGIARPSQRTLERIPAIGKGIEKLRSGIGWVLEQPRKLFEFISTPIYWMDTRMAAVQG